METLYSQLPDFVVKLDFRGKAEKKVGYLVHTVNKVSSGGYVCVLLDLLGNWVDCKFGGGSWIRGIQIGGLGGG